MKQFWRKMIFADRPAQGAFFALWLLLLGSYVSWSICFLLTGSGLLRPLGDSMYWGNIFLCCDIRFWAIQTVIVVAFACLTMRFYIWFALRQFGGWTVGAMIVIVIALLCGFLCGYSNNMAYWGCPALLFGIFPLIFVIACRRRNMAVWALLSGCLLSFGIWGIYFARWHLSYVSRDMLDGRYYDMHFFLTQTLGWQYWHWQWFLTAVILTLVLGGIGYGKILAVAAGVPFPKLWGNALRGLLGLTLGVYVWGWCMTGVADRRLEREKKSLEQFFGEPLNTANWMRRYYGNQLPDAGYWGKLATIQQQLTDKVFRFSGSNLRVPPPATAAPDYERLAKEMDLCRGGMDELVQMLQAPLPRRPVEVRPKTWPTTEQPLEIVQNLSELMLWEIKITADRGDAAAARRAFDALTNLVDFFHQEYVFDSRWVLWQFANDYGRGVELMLENNLLSDQDCDKIIDRLHRYEAQSASWQRSLLYREYLEVLISFEMVDAQPETLPAKFALPSLGLPQIRWLMPSLWYLFCNDFADYLAAGKNIAGVNKTTYLPSMGEHLQKNAQWAVDLSYWQARVRTLEGIIRVKQFQQKNGYYPAAMLDLPTDPFSGRPLRYQPGVYEKTVMNDENYKPVDVKFPVIKVWSLGTDRKDNNGLYNPGQGDDICSMIRISEEKQP